MDFRKREFKYSGGELTSKLSACWPDAFARSLGERHICSALDIIRWMAVILGRDGSFFDRSIYLGPVPLALADFPIPEFTDAQTRREHEEDITSVFRHLAKFGRNGNHPDLLDILESKMMTENFWFNSRYRLYKTTAYEHRGESIHEIKLNAMEIAKECLIRISSPEALPDAIAKVLSPSRCESTGFYQFHAPMPPLFIRVLWDNTLSAASDKRSPFESLQHLTISYDDVRYENNTLVSSQGSASYRLICLARVCLPNEEPVAVHLYNCDGSNFLPPYGNDKDQNWSCKEPGKYYVMYYKSNRARYWLEAGCLTECRAPRPNRKEIQELSDYFRRELLLEKHQEKIQAASKVERHTTIQALRVASADKSAPDIRPTIELEQDQPVANVMQMKKVKMIGIALPEHHSAPQLTVMRPMPTTKSITSLKPVPHITPGPQLMVKPTSVMHPASGSHDDSSTSVKSNRIHHNSTLHNDKHGVQKLKQQDNVFHQNMLSKLPQSPAPSRTVRVVRFEDLDEAGEDNEDEGKDEGESQGAQIAFEQGLQQPASSPKRKRFARGKGGRRGRGNMQHEPSDRYRQREQSRPRERPETGGRSGTPTPKKVDTYIPRDRSHIRPSRESSLGDRRDHESQAKSRSPARRLPSRYRPRSPSTHSCGHRDRDQRGHYSRSRSPSSSPSTHTRRRGDKDQQEQAKSRSPRGRRADRPYRD